MLFVTLCASDWFWFIIGGISNVQTHAHATTTSSTIKDCSVDVDTHKYFVNNVKQKDSDMSMSSIWYFKLLDSN